MESFVIQQSLNISGTIPVRGAKNHALKVLPACLLVNGDVSVENMPLVEDVARMVEIVEDIGGSVKKDSERNWRITAPEHFDGMLSEELIPTLRASVVLIGPLLARFGVVRMPHPGGDKIGKRPINFFLDAFEALGATVKTTDDHYMFEATNGLHGAEYAFPVITVTGTETVMMAAVLAEGETVLHNVAIEPEVQELARQLQACGAQIEGIGTHTLRITGVSELHPPAEAIRVIPDRLEAGSFAILAAATRGQLTITDCDPSHLTIPLQLLSDLGVHWEVTRDTLTVDARGATLRATDIVTHEYPGFPTDLQSPMTVLLTQADGQSSVRETIYEGRLVFTDVLNSMGANIALLDPYRAQVNGPTPLSGKLVASPDIRAGLALIIAGCIAEGTTTIQNIYHIDRGYERIEERFSAIGVNITRTA